MISETELAWVAGFIDGEGSIGIIKTYGRHGQSPTYLIRLEVSNTNREIITFLRDLFGGGLQPDKKRNPAWKDSYKWVVAAKQAKDIIEQITPYLRLKKQQAELALELAKGLGHFYAHHQQLPQCELERREQLYQRMRVLNRRGSIGLTEGLQEKIVTERAQTPKML